MTDEDRVRWDDRYGSGDYAPRKSAGHFLETWTERIPAGRSLDVACGAGRNAIRLAEAGWQVDAVDVSSVAIDMARRAAADAGVEVNWVVADLDTYSLPEAEYDLVSVIRYRNRGLHPQLVRALRPDGWVLVEHHMATPLDVHGPSSPDFRLEPQELLEDFADLRIVFYEETIETRDDDGTELSFALQRLVACNGDPGF